MIPRPFEYYAPASIADALGLLRKYGDEAKLLAGGHSLLPMMKLRFHSPAMSSTLEKFPSSAAFAKTAARFASAR